jgi:formate dehydrogenase major subunit
VQGGADGGRASWGTRVGRDRPPRHGPAADVPRVAAEEAAINEGTLCSKGAATYQYLVNPNRVTTVRYRAPHSDRWEDRPLEWAMDRIARLIKETRDETFVERTPEGKLVNQTTAIASLGGATMDIEENYLIKKLFSGGLGIVSIENQARI